MAEEDEICDFITEDDEERDLDLIMEEASVLPSDKIYAKAWANFTQYYEQKYKSKSYLTIFSSHI